MPAALSKVALIVVLACAVASCKKNAKDDPSPPQPDPRPSVGGPKQQDRKETPKQPSAPETKSATADRDEDYFKVLEQSYELDGVLAATVFWLDCRSAAFDDLQAAKARLVLADALKVKKDALNSGILTWQRLFMDRYKMDTKQWKPDFEKRYPDRQLIHDEASEVARAFCREKSLEISRHLVLELPPNAPNVGEAGWHDYRMEYLRKIAPTIAEQVVDRVRGLDSLKKMKTKVAEAK
ncbi:MAG: hypothetical protein U0791_06840 [Gemmataceae bacterium]